MKFFTIFTALASLSSVVLGDFCGSACDPSKVPNKTYKAPITIVDTKYSITGTIYINNDCEFTVENFTITPKTNSAKWYGTNSSKSTSGILLSNEEVVEITSPKSLSYSVKNTNQFCKASLINDIGENGVFRLLDKNNQLLAYANVHASDEKPNSHSETTTKKTTKKSSTSTKKSSRTKTSTGTKSTKKTKTYTVTSTKYSEKIDALDAPITLTDATAPTAAAAAAAPDSNDASAPVGASVNQGTSTTTLGNAVNANSVIRLTSTTRIGLSATTLNTNQASGAPTLKVSYVIYLALFIFAFYMRF